MTQNSWCSFIVLTLGINSLEQDWIPFDQTFKQRQFSKEEFHYLNVTQVGTFTVYDLFDCTFECLRNILCLSINMAASKGVDGKLWCELLSTDKYRNAENYKENKTSHHFSITVNIMLYFINCSQVTSHSNYTTFTRKRKRTKRGSTIPIKFC